MITFDAEKYQNAIPACCKYKTTEEHCKYLMLCWGLLSAIRNEYKMECVQCEFATRKTEDET